jgi:hypothetical protein
MPKVKNSVYPFIPGGSIDKAYVQRYIRDDREINDIREKGYALPKEGGNQKKYWTAVNQPNVNYPESTKLVRVPRGDVKENKAVSADSIELHDKKTGKWSPIRGGSLGGSSGVGTSANPIEIMLGADLDPKAMIGRAKRERMELEGMKRGGRVKSASSRADGIAQRGKTRGKMR